MVDAVAASGELANTLIIYIVGDNGASTEGGLKEPSTKPHSSTGSGPRVGAGQDASHKTRHTVTAAVAHQELLEANSPPKATL